MKLKQGYSCHYDKALTEWMEFNVKSARKLGIDVDEHELGYIRDHFDEMEQVKIVYDWGKGHFFKVKWESRSWWADDYTHFYYCVMLNIDNVDLKHPNEVLS